VTGCFNRDPSGAHPNNPTQSLTTGRTGEAATTIVSLPGFIDLRSTRSATLNGSVPGA
jgi:hypothetical protein